ncbi:MAG: transposase, partial [Mycoplasmataceae bacterium]|nr:transposase [Mycoplasmataceae bacterium]
MTHKIDKKAIAIKGLMDWLLNQGSIRERKFCRRTILRRMEPYWDELPKIEPTGEIYNVAIIDGVHVTGKTVLIMITPEFVVNFYICDSECYETWIHLLKQVAAPKFVVCDGGCGMLKAIHDAWSTTSIQRCHFHVKLNAKQHLTSRPTTEAGVEILQLVKDLFGIDTITKRDEWIDKLKKWGVKYDEFLKEITRVKSANSKRKWWYTHKNVRSCWHQLNSLVDNGTLFAYLEADGIKVPTTSNKIEGGINKDIKRLVRCHSGLSQFHAMKLVELFLFSKSKF